MFSESLFLDLCRSFGPSRFLIFVLSAKQMPKMFARRRFACPAFGCTARFSTPEKCRRHVLNTHSFAAQPRPVSVGSLRPAAEVPAAAKAPAAAAPATESVAEGAHRADLEARFIERARDMQARIDSGGADSVCAICMASPRLAAAVPCGHAVFCMECLNAAVKVCNCCPLCRTPVTSVLAIFQ